MPNWLFAIVLFLAILVVVVLIERALYLRRQQTRAALGATEGQAEAELGSGPTKANGASALPQALLSQLQSAFGDVRATTADVMTPDYVKLTPQFKAWIENHLNDHEMLQAWLLSLPDEAFKTLTGQIVFFCTDLNIDFRWLIEGELELDPQTGNTVKQIVVLYCEACLKSVQIQDDLTRFSQYQELLNRFERGEQDDLGRRLLTRLNEEQVIPNIAPAIFLAPAKDRRDYILTTLRTAAQKDREKVLDVWKGVLAGRNGKTPN